MGRNAPLLNEAPHPQVGHSDCRTALQHILAGCVQALEGHRSAAADGDADAVHKMRIELTRLGSALLFFSPILTDRGWSRIASRVGALTSGLGSARDQDVMLQYSSRRRYRGWAQGNLRSVERTRAKRYRKLAANLCSGGYRRLLRDIDQQARRPALPIEDEPHSADVALFAEMRLPEWRSEIEQSGRHLGKLGRKQQHRLRLKCKYYRYVVDSLLELGAGLAFQDLHFRDVAKQLHTLLGDARDLRRFKSTGHGRPPHYRATKKKLLNAAAAALRGRR